MNNIKTDIDNLFDLRIDEVKDILKGSPLTYTERKMYEGRLIELEKMKDLINITIFPENIHIVNIEQNQN